MQGISERIRRIKAATNQSRLQTIEIENCESLFPRPKDQEKVDRPQSGKVKKISCTNCSSVYYGQTERSVKTRVTEHKRAVSVFDHDSKISCHVHENDHEMDFGSVGVVRHEANFHVRLFLEAWFSIKDPQSGIDHIAIPEVYKSLAHKSRATFSRNFTRVFLLSARSTCCFLNHAY